MNEKETKKFIKFAQELYKEGLEGGIYLYLDSRYALVFADCGDLGLCGKIAYNCGDLQCDYDWDWTMEDSFDCELTNCESYDISELLTEFTNMYSQLKEGF